MQTRRKPSLVITAAVAVLLGSGGAAFTLARVSSGSTNARPTALDRPVKRGDALRPGLDRTLDLVPGESRAIGTWFDGEANVRKVFVAERDGISTARGPSQPLTCLVVDDNDGTVGSSCNPASDFFGGRSVVWTASSRQDNDGNLTDSYVAGVATESVARVVVVTSDGSEHNVALNENRGFFYDLAPSDRAAGVEPTALVTFDGSGSVLDHISVR